MSDHLIYLAVSRSDNVRADVLTDPACIDLPSNVRDRDVFHDIEGRVFVVLGYIQPSDRILSFLKYVPDSAGKWMSGGVRYRRIFWGSVASTVEGMDILPTDYLVVDPHFGTELLEPPRKVVSKYFKPELRLGEILDEGPKDSLEELVHRGATALHDTLDIPFDNIGVAGSILWRGHEPGHSDVNMNVYGFESSWKLHNNYESVRDQTKGSTLRELPDWEHAISRVHSRVPIMKTEDLQNLFIRRKALCLDSMCIGITPILHPEEVPIQHGSESYHTLSSEPVTITMDIESADYGIFHPAIYEGSSERLIVINGEKVDRILVYDGAFGGLLRLEDRVEVRGTVQKVTRGDEILYQVMVGTKSGAGKEYIRLVS
jgi:predicted nucleotidyltransferase